MTTWPLPAIDVQRPIRHLARPRDLFGELKYNDVLDGYFGAALCGAYVVDLPAATATVRGGRPEPTFMHLPECETCGAMAVAILGWQVLDGIA